MNKVVVAILHPDPEPNDGSLTRATAGARRTSAQGHVRGFLDVGAAGATIVAGPSDGRPFSARLLGLLADVGSGGLIVLGSGAIPLATAADRRALVTAAGADHPQALANNRYSADVIAIARAREALSELTELATDNALPRWLAEVGAVPVDDLARRWRLGVDIDGPLDLVLLGGRWASQLDAGDARRVGAVLVRVRAVTRDPSAELVVTGRVSTANLTWLEAHTASRTRALIEERGLRTAPLGQRPAASALGGLLDVAGPAALGRLLGRFGEAAIVDTRVLLAHRLGTDERRWPGPEDRYASDLLLHERIDDPWLRDLTRAAAEAPIPVLLGGHTLVGPGLRLALRRGI